MKLDPKRLLESTPPLRVAQAGNTRNAPQRTAADKTHTNRGGNAKRVPGGMISQRERASMRLPHLDPAPTARQKLARGLDRAPGGR